MQGVRRPATEEDRLFHSSHYRSCLSPSLALPWTLWALYQGAVKDSPLYQGAVKDSPLPRSSKGHKYILVIYDYATQYPEAVPLRTCDAEAVAEELVKLFSQVGIPKETLTDQGTNFISQLLAELYRLLNIHSIRTTPYHPQTDGLVVRFSQTLKAMLRRTVTQEGKDWDRLFPYLLFAYREVPQASTGFSPFELL